MTNPINLDAEHAKSLSAAYRVRNDVARKAAFKALACIQDLQQRGKTSDAALLSMHHDLRSACHGSNYRSNLRAATLAVLAVLVLLIPSQASKLADSGHTGLDGGSTSRGIHRGLVAAFGERRHAQFRPLPPCTPATPALCHEAFAPIQIN